MKRFLIALFLLAAAPAFAATPAEVKTVQQDDHDGWKITEDKTAGGIRFVTAVPCNVCSKLIEVEIIVKTHVIRHCKFTRGCPGNTLGLCSLLEGLTVEEAVKRLDGIDCGGRGTSCPDQLARVLKSLKW